MREIFFHSAILCNDVASCDTVDRGVAGVVFLFMKHRIPSKQIFVSYQDVMGWIYTESSWLNCPDFADVLEGCEPLQGLQPSGEVVRADECVEAGTDTVVEAA